jgi:hypothetical protein
MDLLRDLTPKPWMIWVKLAGVLIVTVLIGWVVWKLFFADIQKRVAAEKGGRVVAEEQVKAEANIADKTIERVRERDVYREHVTNIVHEGQGKVDAVWDGKSVGKDADAAGAGALCKLHDSLCRGAPAGAEVQPVRQPVPGADRARSAPGK